MRAEQEGGDRVESERVLHPHGRRSGVCLAGEEGWGGGWCLVLKDGLSQAGGGAPR